MDTSQIITRENRITTARQSCMMQLGRKYKSGVIEQEKHEKKYLSGVGENELHERRFPSLGIRLFFGVLLFLFVFLIRESQIRFQGMDYNTIREHILDNHVIEKAEEYVQLHLVQ